MVNEVLKKTLLGLGVVVCLILVFFLSFNFVGDEEEIVDLEEKEVEMEEEVEEEKNVVNYEVGAFPDSIQKNSIKVYFDEFFDDDGELNFVVQSEDVILDKNLSKEVGNYWVRSPLFWNSYVYLYKGEMKELFLMDSTSDGRYWSNTFGADVKELGKYYVGQKIRFIYTTKRAEEIVDVVPKEIGKLDQTFVFEMVIPQEVYDTYS